MTSMPNCLALSMLVFAVLAATGCGESKHQSVQPDTSPSVTPPTAALTTAEIIDWVQFVKFDGVTYVAHGPLPPLEAEAVNHLPLGPTYAQVKFKVSGNITTSGYRIKD